MARILLIDDEAEFRALIKAMLERAGYEVILATNGAEGLRSYRESPVDLVITDIIMPEKEGVETILDLKRDYPDVKIIAISGGGRITATDFLNMAAKFGANRTLAKPFRRDVLLETIRDVLGE